MVILRRTISALLALVLVVTMLPLSALATETEPVGDDSHIVAEETNPETETVGTVVPDGPSANETEAVETVPETTAPEVSVEETAEVVAADVATSGTCGENLTWTLVDGVLTICGEGDMYDYDQDEIPWDELRKNITSVVIENGVTSIDDCAFAWCDSLSSITIPDNVTSIGDGAFFNSCSLSSVTIGNSVTSIGDYAFDLCYCLTSIHVNESNMSFASVNGVLYTKDMTVLVRYPEGKRASQYIIPDSVTSIGNRAFYGCESLTSITIGNDVTSIGDRAFDGCYGLNSVTIGNSVTSIGVLAFHQCDSLSSITIPGSITSIGYAAFRYSDSLTDVYYGGSKEQWANITIAANNECLTNANIHYNSTGAEGDDIEETPSPTEPSSPESNYHLVLSPSEKTLTAKVGETLTITCHLYNGDEKVTDWKLSNFNCPFVFGVTFLETGDGCEYRLTGTEPGTFKISFYEATHDVKAEVTVIITEDSSAEDMWYETQEVQKQAYNHVKNYIRDWYDAYKGYVKAVDETLQAYTEKTEKTREELIATEAKRMRKHDDNKANRSKYISVGIDDRYLDYAYLALAAYFYDGTRTQMPDFSSLDVTNEKNIATQIAKLIVKNISSETRSYQFDSVTVMVGGCSYFGVGFGDIVMKRNNERVGMTAFSSTLSECQASVMAYMEELRDMGTGAVWNVAASVYNDILGVNLLNLTDSWLNTVVMKIEKNLAVKLTEKFHIAGVGNLLDTIRDSYSFYSLSLKITETSTTDDVQKILNNLLGYKFEDDTIEKWAVKSAMKELKKAANKLNRALNEYLEGTIVEKEDGFWRVVFGCPVSISVYNSTGEQIGYVGDDDLWYTDAISITELGGVKEIVSFTEDELSITVTATDYGTMSCVFEQYDEAFTPVGRLNYYNIILEPEQAFQVSIPENLEEKADTLAFTSGGEEIYADEYISAEDSASVTVTCSPITEDGIVGGTVSGTGTYIRGDSIVLRTEAYDGFKFIGWFDGEYLVCTEDIYEFPAQENREIIARFYKEKPIVIDLDADIGGAAIGSSRFDSGEAVILIAIPQHGYSFDGWYAGEKLVSTAAEYNFPASESLTLRAAFSQKEHLYELGDPTHDGIINAKDSTRILQFSVGALDEEIFFCETCADVSGDGDVSAKDSTLILQYSVGQRTEFPAQK